MTTPAHRLDMAGSAFDLFNHMALWGLAAICADAGIQGVRGSWTDGRVTNAVLWSAADGREVAQAVIAHAQRRAEPGSWLTETFDVSSTAKPSVVATMAPRTASPTSDERWGDLDAEAHRIENALPSALDEALLAGLGYRAWWVYEGRNRRPDRGCSVWEMRTRNKGTDVVADRLLPLAREVASWSGEKVLAGLEGTESDDVVGGNAATSRSATGFRLPGPADNARAWCALWGLSLLPVMPALRHGGHTPAWAPRHSVSSSPLHHLLMVVPDQPMPPARFARLQASSQLVTAATDMADRNTPRPLPERRLALSWLRERGAGVVLRFPVQYVGSASAPERQALAGERVRL